MNNLVPFTFAALTALCWGLYGPMLAKARSADGPFKPYVAIGVAYLVIAILGGIVGMIVRGDNFSVSGEGARWGLVAGAVGALGALFLTLCMVKGGNKIPEAMMPVVFGGAVAITALYTIWASGGKLHASPMLWVGVVGMLISVVLITTNTPSAHPATKPPEAAQQTAAAQAGAAVGPGRGS